MLECRKIVPARSVLTSRTVSIEPHPITNASYFTFKKFKFKTKVFQILFCNLERVFLYFQIHKMAAHLKYGNGMPNKTRLSRESIRDLAQKAIAARKRAIAPYSNFYVGAAIITRDGRIYEAGNIESSSYGLTICAERVALFKALSDGETEFSAIAIAAGTQDFCSPCGACRQVLWDYAPDIEVILVNQVEEIQTYSLKELLPNAFDKKLL